MTTVEVLRAARARIAGGWVQGHGGDADTYCVMSATGAMDCDFEAEFAADDYVQRAIGVGSIREAIAWNDAPERTQADVLAALDKAIALAESAVAP